MTEREQRFVKQYLICWNGAQAAKHAGFSPKWADRAANRLLKRNDIKQEIEARTSVLTQKAEIGQERLLTEFLQLGLSNIGDYVTWTAEGKVMIKPTEELSRGQMAAIQSIESTTDTRKVDGVAFTTHKLKFKLHPKEGPLTKLGEKYGLFPKEAQGMTLIQHNYHKSNSPLDLDAYTPKERALLRQLLEKGQVKVVGERQT